MSALSNHIHKTPQESSPNHVAIIMDGNGRWAKKRLLPRSAGHKKGSERVGEIIQAALEEEIQYLTLFCFSTENWQRDPQEVNTLFELLKQYIDKHTDEFIKKDIRIKVLGDKSACAQDVITKLDSVEQKTAHCKTLQVNVALNYGAQQEIVQAVQIIAKAAQNNALKVEDIDQTVIENHLYTMSIPAPDLLIRTSGELRLSNFLLWQLAYTELYFTDILWPDFKTTHFVEALQAYTKRIRRYGG